MPQSTPTKRLYNSSKVRIRWEGSERGGNTVTQGRTYLSYDRNGMRPCFAGANEEAQMGTFFGQVADVEGVMVGFLRAI